MRDLAPALGLDHTAGCDLEVGSRECLPRRLLNQTHISLLLSAAILYGLTFRVTCGVVPEYVADDDEKPLAANPAEVMLACLDGVGRDFRDFLTWASSCEVIAASRRQLALYAKYKVWLELHLCCLAIGFLPECLAPIVVEYTTGPRQPQPYNNNT